MARREYQRPNVQRHDSPEPYWYIRYRVRVYNEEKRRFERKEKWHRLGNCKDMTKRQAEREGDRVMAEANNQVLTLREHLPFREFVELYRRDFMPNLGKGTRAKYTSLLDTHVLHAFGGLSLTGVTTQRIQAFLTQKKTDGLSWWARSDLRNLISGLFTTATIWGYWSKPNPVKGTNIGATEWKRDNRALTDAEVHLLIKSLADPVRLIVETLVLTGMRTSEIFGLKWKYVDLDRNVFLIRERNYRGDQDKPKSRRSRRDLPIGSLANRYRKLRGEPDDFVFNENGAARDERSVLRYQLRPVAKRLGIYFEGFGWHSFRRAHLTVLSEVGATAFETRDQAGHSKIETTMTYVKPALERRQKAVERLAKGSFRKEVRELCGINRAMKPLSLSAVLVFSRGWVVGLTELESVTSTVSR